MAHAFQELISVTALVPLVHTTVCLAMVRGMSPDTMVHQVSSNVLHLSSQSCQKASRRQQYVRKTESVGLKKKQKPPNHKNKQTKQSPQNLVPLSKAWSYSGCFSDSQERRA